MRKKIRSIEKPKKASKNGEKEATRRRIKEEARGERSQER